MKKFIAVMLSLAMLMPSFQMSSMAQGELQDSVTSTKKNTKSDHALKLFAKFSIPISTACALAGIGGIVYYKYKNSNFTITGEVTKERAEEIFKDINKLKDSNRRCKLIFKDVTIRKDAFKLRNFDFDVLLTGKCIVEPDACEYTYFTGKFEIDGEIANGSSLKGAIFKHNDLIIKGKIPDNLLHGALVLIKTSGTKYKLPGKPEIIYDKQNATEFKKYLETFVK